MKDSNATLWDKALSSIKASYTFLVNIPVTKFIKVVLYVIIILAIYTAFNWINRTANMGAYMKASEKVVKNTAKSAFIEGAADVDSMRVLQKMKEASISDEVDDNLNDISLNILNSLDADRSLISLFHDGEYTSGHIDFKFMNECYEKTAKNRNVVKITGYFRDPNGRYEDIPTRDLPIYRYLREHKEGFFIGNIKELANIDADYAARMSADGTGYVALYYVHEDGLPLSIISVSWQRGNNKYAPNDSILNTLREYAGEAKPYLYIDAYNKMKQSITNG